MSKRRASHCPSGKVQIRQYRTALSVKARADRDGREELRIYHCTQCGSYHVTSLDKDEYDKKRRRYKS